MENKERLEQSIAQVNAIKEKLLSKTLGGGSVSAELIEWTIGEDIDLSSGSVEFLPKYLEPIEEDLDLSTITVDKNGSSYGFEYSTSTLRLEPKNKGNINSFAYGKIVFNVVGTGSLAVTVYQSSEANYDFGFISKLDTLLNKNYDSSDSNAVYTSKGLSGSYTYTFTDIPEGEHFITFKYRKDGSQNSGSDTFAISKIHLNSNVYVSADGFSKVTLEKPTDLSSENILSGKKIFGINGGIVIPDYQSTTATNQDVLVGKTFLSNTGEIQEGNLVVADYQSTTAKSEDVLLGKKFLSNEGVIIEGSLESFTPETEYNKNMVIYTKGKYVTDNITVNITSEGARDAKETMYEMQEADYMRYLQGQISYSEIPSEDEYLEQQDYVNEAIASVMGEEF